MTPNETANEILRQLRACRDESECIKVSNGFAVEFARIQKEAPVRAIHIVNLAALMKSQFEQAREKHNKQQGDFFA